MSEEQIVEERITWDHRFFYLEGKRFFPETGRDHVCILIPSLSDETILEAALDAAREAVLSGKLIVWELDFGWDKKPLFIQDTASFFALGLWIEELFHKILLPFKDSTLAAVLFKGGSDFTSYFVWSEQQELLYQERESEYACLEESEKRLFFAADVFSEYLQRLCSFLPQSVAPVCLFDAGSITSLAKLSYLFSQERFGHLLTGLKNAPFPLTRFSLEGQNLSSRQKEAALGICLPPFEVMSEEKLTFLDNVLEKLLVKGIDFRVIPEQALHESWDGIDDLIVFSSWLGSQGLRKMRGFSAAGGRLVYVGETLGLEEEIPLTQFLE